MRKLLLIAAATLAVASCGPDNNPAQHNDTDLGRYAPRAVEAKLYHFKNGSVGYQDNGVWYYVIFSQSNPSDTSNLTSGRSLGLTGSYANTSFAKGNPPSEEEVEQANVEEVEAVEGEAATGDSEATTESEAGESSDGGAADSGGGGGDGGGGGGDGGGGGGGE